MTVVVAFVGADGAVMASDSEATESGHTRYDVEKIWTCGGLLCGYTGNGSVRDRLRRAMDDAAKQLFGDSATIDRYKAANVLQQVAKPVLEHVYSHFVPAAPGQHYGLLAGVLLIVGRDDAGYWLLEVDGSNNASWYTDAGFHTVGSGSPAAYVAYALMKNYDVASRDVAAQRLVAYRTVDTCIGTIGGQLGVGGYVHLWSSEGGGPFEKQEGETLNAVQNGVDQWTTIERESLDKISTIAHPEPSSPSELPEDRTGGTGASIGDVDQTSVDSVAMPMPPADDVVADDAQSA